MKKLSVTIFALFVNGCVFAASVSAGGDFFFGLSSGHFVSPGGALFFGSHRANPRFFLGFGTRAGPFLQRRRPWGDYYAPPVGTPYLPADKSSYERFSGTDASGALYVDGYRVMPSGGLRVQVEPAAAQVLIDGFPAAVDQTSGITGAIGIPVGNHLIEVLRTGFEPYRADVDVKQAREVFLEIKLKQQGWRRNTWGSETG